MPELCESLESAGFDSVQTYLQSGNVVLTSGKSAAEVAQACERQIEQSFGLDIDVVTRTRSQLAKVVERNPLAEVATDPKRYQVSFLSAKPAADVMRKLEEAAAEQERVVLPARRSTRGTPTASGG